jgi:VWFA-related protein
MLGAFSQNGVDEQNESKVAIVPREHVARHKDPRSPAALRLDVKVVLIPVNVTNTLGRPVTDLRVEDFELFEDNVKQKIAFVTTEEAPVSLGVIFDSSGSMAKKMDTSVAAIEQFFKMSMPGDECLLVQFSDRPSLITDFTSDIAEVSGFLHSFRPGGWTALHDAIYLGIKKMKAARNSRKALLILSDGGDNNSRYSATETKRLVQEADVRIYSVSLLQGSHFLEQISDESGGESVRVHKMGDLPTAMEKLNREIRGHYVLGYYSTNSQNDGRYRNVRVRVNQPAVRASWRHGYYAPD